MRKISLWLFAAALAAVSCIKEPGDNSAWRVDKVPIPEDFDWAMTQDMQIAVAAPTVDGQAPEYAVVRVYASPVLTDENLVAKGVTTGAVPFRTALTIPAAVENVYVKTTLPDGSAQVAAVQANKTVSVAGTAMKRLAAATPKMRIVPTRGGESDMPEYPKMELKGEKDFAKEVVIAETPAMMYDLGADYVKWNAGMAVAEEYYIPAGAEITGNINLNGGQSPYRNPVLYVAGKLTMDQLHIGSARLAVLPGGVVTVGTLSANDSGSADKPAIYVFEDGAINVREINFSGKCLVNCGNMNVVDKFDMNGSGTFFNTTSASFSAKDDVKCSNSVVINDGKFTVSKGKDHDDDGDVELNGGARFENRSNGEMDVHEFKMENSGNKFIQAGRAKFHELDVTNGECYINCYTYADEVEGENGKFYLSAGACLESLKAELNNTHVDMASGSLFITQKYEDDDEHGNVEFKGTGEGFAVVRIENELEVDAGRTKFFGNLEIVFPEGTHLSRFEKAVKNPAFATLEQETNIPATQCNGGKGEITPEPEKPLDDYEMQAGETFTYCFEDMWPRLGDYDMNDAVVVCRIDRNRSKEGDKVKSLDINWELKAAGTQRTIAFALQMDAVDASAIASVESEYKLAGGIFRGEQPEAGNEQAVIPLFNDTRDILTVSANTWAGKAPAETTKYKTTVTFVTPVDAEDVMESKMNFFVAVNKREQEIHMPTFEPTKFGEVGEGNFLPTDPYKFYVEKPNRDAENNYMMWALQIPGEFRYPAEMFDIRSVYEHFNAWAASGGVYHKDWYKDEADKEKLF